MENSILSRLGIHQQGVDIYLDLLSHGASSIADIARRTKFERTIVYRRIPELISTGIVEREVIGKRYRYEAAHPSAFQGILSAMDDELATAVIALESMVRKRSGSSVPKVRVIHGPDASTKVYEEAVRILPRWGVYFRYSSRSTPNDKIRNLGSYHRLRDEKRIERMVITNEDLARLATPKAMRELVYLPSTFPFKQNFQKVIFADRVAIIDLETSTACIIESKMLASFEEAIFRCLFNFLRAEKEGRFE